jgi:hypothetical protein
VENFLRKSEISIKQKETLELLFRKGKIFKEQLEDSLNKSKQKKRRIWCLKEYSVILKELLG